MALYFLARQSNKLRGCQKLGITQLSTFNKFSSVEKLLVPKQILKNELTQPLLRKFSLTAPKNAMGSDHATIWKAERILSVALLGVIPAALIFPSQGLDALLAISVVMHQYWGLEAIVTDYVRPIIFGNTVPKVAHGLLLLLTITTLAGLFQLIYNDIGIAKALRKLWAVKGA